MAGCVRFSLGNFHEVAATKGTWEMRRGGLRVMEDDLEAVGQKVRAEYYSRLLC